MADKQPWERDSAETDPWERDAPEANGFVDAAQSLGRGVVKGAAGMAGLPGTVAGLMEQGGDWVGDKLGLPPATPEMKNSLHRARPISGQGIEQGIEKVAGEFQEPKTTAGRYAQSVGEMLPAGMAGPGGLVAKGLASVAGGLGAEKAAEMFPGHEALARSVGGILGFSAPRMAARGVTPLPASAARQEAVDLLAQEGVTGATAGQRTGREALKYWESHLGDAPGAGGAATTAREQVGTQFTRAALRRAGVVADRATPDVIDGAFRRIGQDLDNLATRNPARVDPQFLNDIHNARTEYENVVQQGSRRNIIDNFIDDIIDRAVQNPVLSGEQYQRFRSRLTTRQRGAFADPEYSHALGDFIEALDGLMLRSMQASGSPDIGLWELARRQYRNLIPLARASTGAGEQAASGILTPAKMREVLTGSQRGQRDYARGRGDFADLVRAANEVLPPLPNSGTGQREMVRAATTAAGAGLGSLLGFGAEGAGAGAIAGAVMPGVAGRAVMNPLSQSYLGNQAAARAGERAPSLRSGAAKVGLTELGAQKAPDGQFYIPDPEHPGKFYRVNP